MNKKQIVASLGIYVIGIIVMAYFATHRYHVWHLVLSPKDQYFINMSFWTYVTILVVLVYGGIYLLRDYIY